jgi:hypothetical protein
MRSNSSRASPLGKTGSSAVVPDIHPPAAMTQEKSSARRGSPGSARTMPATHARSSVQGRNVVPTVPTGVSGGGDGGNPRGSSLSPLSPPVPTEFGTKRARAQRGAPRTRNGRSYFFCGDTGYSGDSLVKALLLLDFRGLPTVPIDHGAGGDTGYSGYRRLKLPNPIQGSP